jgi:hypothetical protein
MFECGTVGVMMGYEMIQQDITKYEKEMSSQRLCHAPTSRAYF